MDTQYIDLSKANPADLKPQQPIQAQVVSPFQPGAATQPAQPLVTCRHCGGPMHAHSQTTGQAMGVGLGLLLMGLAIIGGLIALGLCFTIVGMIFGVPLGLISIGLFVAAMFCGGRTEHFWRCSRCFSVVPRA